MPSSGRTVPTLSRMELQRYSRPLLVPEWQQAGAQEKVKAGRILVVGAGGLGGAVIPMLAGAGVGQLWVADGDTVSLNNLHRQRLYTSEHVGYAKAKVAVAQAQAINPFVEVRTLGQFTPQVATEWLSEVDLVVDATDNFTARYAIDDACKGQGKAMVWGAASGWTGMVSVFANGYTLRNLFPSPSEADSCDETGVIGPIPNVIGQIMALEALKILGGVGDSLQGRLWIFDGLTGQTRIVKLAENSIEI